MLTYHQTTEAEKYRITAWEYEGEYAIYNATPYAEQKKKGFGFANPLNHFYSFYAGEELVGFINLYEEETEVFFGIGVAPAHCGKGYGRQMTEIACLHAFAALVSRQAPLSGGAYLEYPRCPLLPKGRLSHRRGTPPPNHLSRRGSFLPHGSPIESKKSDPRCFRRPDFFISFGFGITSPSGGITPPPRPQSARCPCWHSAGNRSQCR